MARALSERRLSPVDLVESFLARIRRYDPELRAYTEVHAAAARRAAEVAARAQRAGVPIGPLHGVPIAIKDLIAIEGTVYEGGSLAFRGRVARETASVVGRALAAGMIVLGKTHTVEFAFGGWGTNKALGTPLNPWDRREARAPGGSSSGSGVAVAARLAPWAVGTDTGGSVRLPAAFCGLTGLKVTVGRISTHGIQPLSPTLDTPGPMAQTVEDAALLYQVLRGPDRFDPRTLLFPPDEPMRTLNDGVGGLRLGRMPPAEREGVDAAVLAAYDQSLDVLARLGAEIIDVAPPMPFLEYARGFAIAQYEAYREYGALAEDPAQKLDPDVRQRLLESNVSPAVYRASIEARERAKLEWERVAAAARLDALLTPTTAMRAVTLAAVDQAVLPSRFTRFANILDLCALALPNGFGAGLPTSLQIICAGGREALALRIGQAFQQATEWHQQVPQGFGLPAG